MKTSGAWNLLFEGRDVSLLARGSGPTAVITFDFYRPPEAEPRFFFELIIEVLGQTHLHVRAWRNHWYQTPEMNALPALTRPLNPVLAFGSSMGGTGALWHGEALGARRIITGAPQTTIHPERYPHDTRWVLEGSALSFPEVLPGVPGATVFYDREVTIDARHAAMWGKAGAELVEVPGAGHEPIVALIEQKRIFAIIQAAVNPAA
jgi:hypothetical protein